MDVLEVVSGLARFNRNSDEKVVRTARKVGQLTQRVRVREIDIINSGAGIIARLANDESVAGNWTFSQNLRFKSGTSFIATLDHGITADRTYTLPDGAGTFTLNEANEVISGVWTFSQNLRFKSGTAFVGTIQHANTAARTYTFPDADGTVPLKGSNETITGSWQFNGNVTLNDGVNLLIGATSGTKIANASTDKLGFWGATPVVRPTDPTNLTDNSTGTAGGTVKDVTAAFDRIILNNNFASVADRLNAVMATLRSAGLIG